MNREFDKIIKDKLGNFEEAPPPYIWDKIAAAKPVVAAKIPFYRSVGFKVAAVAASILLFIGLSWLKRNSDLVYQENFAKEKENKSIAFNQNTNIDETITAKSNSTIGLENSINENGDNTSKNNNRINNIDKLENTSSTKKVVATNNNISNKFNTEKKPENKGFKTNILSSNNSNIQKSEDDKTSSKISIPETSLVVSTVSNKSSEVTAENITVTEDPKQQKIEKVTSNEVELANNSEKQNIEEDSIQESLENNSTEVLQTEIANNDILEEEIEAATDVNIGKDFNPRTREFNKYGFGIHYGYEKLWINKVPLDNHNIDLSFNYRNLSFILQTGIGAQFSKDRISYNVEYKRNDYLTTEMRFDSATFVLDSNGIAKIVPVNPYYEDIYDSINHTYSNDFTEYYYSLRLPLLVGYQKDYGKFGLTAKGGFIYSILISKQRTEVYSPDEASRVVMLQYDGAERVSAQIQYVLSVGIVYRLNKSFHLQCDLMGKYYQNSIYETSVYSKMNPWSAEARLGLVYFIN